MKVVIAGSRTIRDENKVRVRIHQLLSQLKIVPTEIVSGKAIGPDQIGETYANLFKIPVKEMPANWNKHGKSAGPIRNKEMAKHADIAIVFWDGESTGSKNMIEEMSKQNKPCIVEIV
jgi:hypothetical protein